MSAQIWDLWFPSAGATGVSFARARMDADAAGDRLLVHAAPPRLEVTVRDEDGLAVASGKDLERDEPGPMCYLVRDGAKIRLESGWPDERDIGRLVILPGGEAGTLRRWWHADDRSEWRWEIEFYNHV